MKFGSTKQKQTNLITSVLAIGILKTIEVWLQTKSMTPIQCRDEQLYQTLTTNDQIDINEKQPFLDDYLTNRSFQNKSKLLELLPNHILWRRIGMLDNLYPEI